MLICRVPVMPVLLSAMVMMAVGMVWYSPLLFGKRWMTLSGIDPGKTGESGKKGMAATYLVSFLSGLALSFVLGYLLTRTSSASPLDAMRKAFFCWAGFVAPAQLGGVLWEGKPLALYAINTGYYLVTMILSALILVSMVR